MGWLRQERQGRDQGRSVSRHEHPARAAWIGHCYGGRAVTMNRHGVSQESDRGGRRMVGPSLCAMF